MSFLRRLHPYDLVAGAIVLTVLVYLLVTVPGYRWSRAVQGGFLREQPMVVTLEVTHPTMVRLAAGLSPGLMEAWTPRGRKQINLLRVDPGPEGSVRVTLDLLAQVDGSGRRFWADQQLRRGQSFDFGDRSFRVSGVLVAVEEPEGKAR